MEFGLTFHSVGNVIIPTVTHSIILQRGSNHQAAIVIWSTSFSNQFAMVFLLRWGKGAHGQWPTMKRWADSTWGLKSNGMQHTNFQDLLKKASEGQCQPRIQSGSIHLETSPKTWFIESIEHIEHIEHNCKVDSMDCFQMNPATTHPWPKLWLIFGIASRVSDVWLSHLGESINSRREDLDSMPPGTAELWPERRCKIDYLL